MYELNRMAPKDGKAKLLLLGNFDPEGVKEIRDPYYVSRIRTDLQSFQVHRIIKHFSQMKISSTGFKFAGL